jgi:hypothetical protein
MIIENEMDFEGAYWETLLEEGPLGAPFDEPEPFEEDGVFFSLPGEEWFSPEEPLGEPEKGMPG